MVRDFNMPIKIRVIETVRENDGLAMSSRNTYLTEEQRKSAPILYKALSCGKKLCEEQKFVTRTGLYDVIQYVLRQDPAVSLVEYISIASHEDMTELTEVDLNRGAVISSAIRIGNVRLIDNVLVGKAQKDILN
jgi:pantoate--beta-alanine ligase